MGGLLRGRGAEERSLFLIKKFLSDSASSYNFKVKARKLYKILLKIQRRIRDNGVTKYSKVEVLVNYWDKLYGQLQVRASKKNDQAAKGLLLNIIKVPKPVQNAVLGEYVRMCQ